MSTRKTTARKNKNRIQRPLDEETPKEENDAEIQALAELIVDMFLQCHKL
jgi:hypothetical protein